MPGIPLPGVVRLSRKTSWSLLSISFIFIKVVYSNSLTDVAVRMVNRPRVKVMSSFSLEELEACCLFS